MRNRLFNYLTLAMVFLSLPLFWMVYPILNLQINLLTYIGLILIIPSLVFFTIARIQLGNSFQASAKANKLVTEGIYKKIRHPIYLFGLLFILGTILLMQMLYLLIFWGGLILLQSRRIKNEEKVLEEAYGKEYIDYKKSTWF